MWVAKDDRDQRRALSVLALASLFCSAMVVTRVIYSGRGAYLFFCWNLALAWVPLGLSLALARRHRRPAQQTPAGNLASWGLAALWLLFFPNAPYIVTDLVHLRARAPVPLWFDAVLIFAFALTGLCLGFASLLLVHRVVARSRGPRLGWAFVGAVSLLTGFGVYLGRFQRWNSWSVVTRPGELLADVVERLLNPMAHPRAVGMTVLVAALFAIAYLMLLALTGLGPVGSHRATATAGSTTSTSTSETYGGSVSG